MNKLGIVGKGGFKCGVRLSGALVIITHLGLVELSLLINVLILEHVDITLIIDE